MFLSSNFHGLKFRGVVGVLALVGAGHAAMGAATEVDKLLASDGAAGDSYGRAVAIDGDVAIVGAPWNDTKGIDAGAAYIYRLDGGGWVQEPKLTASDGAGGDEFGIAVDVSEGVIVVGAWQDDTSVTGAGSAYIYRYNGANWVETKLHASDALSNDRLGIAVAIDGDIAVVGADQGDASSASDSGAAYVYQYSGGIWTQVAKLTASDAAEFDQFGCAVDIDGDVIVVGARSDDDSGLSSGAAYVFERPGTSWFSMTESFKLVASDAAAGDHLGESVSVSGDTIVVGSPGDGSAYAFTDDGSAWLEEKLTGSLAGAADTFGYAVAVSGDLIAVGAFTANTQSGLLTIFQRSTYGWGEVDYFWPADWAEFDQFGRAVGISSQNVLIVGSPGDDREDVPDPPALNAGSAYLLQFTPELDSDGDGLFDSEELELGTDPVNPDTDGDVLEDGYEVALAGDGDCPSPLEWDSDGDGSDDGMEVIVFHSNPCDLLDTDGDGLTDDDEINLYGTNPNEVSSDLDHLSDFVEVDLALANEFTASDIKNGLACPDPWAEDSDDDGLPDGAEVGYDGEPGTGTSPCDPDSDDDGVGDAIDPTPLDPGATGDWIEEELRDTRAVIAVFDLDLIEAKNNNAAKGRRNAMSNKVNGAANAVADGDILSAIDKLTSLLAKLDDDPTPPDWMVEGTAQKEALRTEIELMIDLLYYEL